MNRIPYIIFFCLLLISSCTKPAKTRTSGTDTIDNTTYTSTTYYNYGFSFSTAKLVSTEASPGPDITVYVNQSSQPSRLTLQANTLTPPFFKFGEYPDAASASAAFTGLTSFTAAQWTDMADPVVPNQIWIFRNKNEHYAKILILNTVNEIRQTIPYGEVTFQWVYQPDGSTTFPSK